MKLQLSTSWYLKRAKAEEACSDVAAGAKSRSTKSAATVARKSSAKRVATKTGAKIRSGARRKAK
jgi:hypothetical protein